MKLHDEFDAPSKTHRVVFELDPAGETFSELRLELKSGDEQVSEILDLSMDVVEMTAEVAAPQAAPLAAGEMSLNAPPTPVESRLSMPAQSIFKFDTRGRRRRLAATRDAHRPAARDGEHAPARPVGSNPWLARLVTFGGGAALTAYGGYEMYPGHRRRRRHGSRNGRCSRSSS